MQHKDRGLGNTIGENGNQPIVSQAEPCEFFPLLFPYRIDEVDT